MIFNNDKMIAAEDGSFISEKVQNVVEAIRQYDSNIEVEYIPSRARAPQDQAFRLIHRMPGKPPYVMFHVKDESQFDERVLKKIIYNDQAKEKTPQAEYEAWEEAQRRVYHQKFLDRIEEANDIAYHVLRSPLNTYKVDKDITIRDYGNSRRRR